MKSTDIEDRLRKRLGAKEIPSDTSTPSFVGIHPNSLDEIAKITEIIKKTCNEAIQNVRSFQTKELAESTTEKLVDYFQRILRETTRIENTIKPEHQM